MGHGPCLRSHPGLSPHPITWAKIAGDLTDRPLANDDPTMLGPAARIDGTPGFVVYLHGHAGEVGIAVFTGTRTKAAAKVVARGLI